MQALQTSIVTINMALTAGLLTMYFLTMYLLKCCRQAWCVVTVFGRSGEEPGRPAKEWSGERAVGH
jgi:hypothetical protein